jgi:hypothetical protein
MSASGEVSVFSRFVVKFVEITAAGLATAVSGYLIAHLSGAFSSPVPLPERAVIDDTRNASPPAPSPSSIPDDRNDQQTAPKQELTVSPVAQPAPPVNTTKIAPPRKHTEPATTAAESKRDQQSLAARVRAALATVDANRTRHLAMPPQGDARPNPAGAASPQVQPSIDSSRDAVTGTAVPTVEPAPVPAQPRQPNPLIAVEIQSRPVAAGQPPATPPVEKETGVLSGLEQLLRQDPLAGSEDAPRPPMPVGQ